MPFVDDDDDQFTPTADLDKRTNGGISYYQYNKIRILLSAIQKKNGFPARDNHTVAFYSLLMFSLPFYTRLALLITQQAWADDPAIYMKNSITGRYIMFEKSNYHDQIASLLDKGPGTWRWRYILIHDIPNELINTLVGSIPIVGDLTQFATYQVLQATSIRPWPLYDYLISKGGLHDVVIKTNWNKIRKELNDNGY